MEANFTASIRLCMNFSQLTCTLLFIVFELFEKLEKNTPDTTSGQIRLTILKLASNPLHALLVTIGSKK
jgi:hypothetical protein